MDNIINEIESLIDIVRALHPTKVVEEEPKKRVKRVKEVKRIPIHNHSIDEVFHQDCELCRTHGNVFDINLLNVCFEVM